jgi:hypothetical protein
MINRRHALRMGLTGSAACAAMAQQVAGRFIDRKRGGHGFKSVATAKRPNIFLLTADTVCSAGQGTARTTCIPIACLLRPTNCTICATRTRGTCPPPPHPKHLRKEMIESLGAVLERDPRWQGYCSRFRIDKFFDLPRQNGDMQLRAAIERTNS